MSDNTPADPPPYPEQPAAASVPPAPPAAPPAYGQPVAPNHAQPGVYPQAAYGGYGYPAAQKTNVMAILSLVFAFVFSILGVVFGHIALSQIKRTGESGHGLAVAGLVIGYVLVGLTLIFVVLYVIIIIAAISSSAAYGSLS